MLPVSISSLNIDNSKNHVSWKPFNLPASPFLNRYMDETLYPPPLNTNRLSIVPESYSRHSLQRVYINLPESLILSSQTVHGERGMAIVLIKSFTGQCHCSLPTTLFCPQQLLLMGDIQMQHLDITMALYCIVLYLLCIITHLNLLF